MEEQVFQITTTTIIDENYQRLGEGEKGDSRVEGNDNLKRPFFRNCQIMYYSIIINNNNNSSNNSNNGIWEVLARTRGNRD